MMDENQPQNVGDTTHIQEPTVEELQATISRLEALLSANPSTTQTPTVSGKVTVDKPVIGEPVHYHRDAGKDAKGNPRDPWCVPAIVVSNLGNGEYILDVFYDHTRDGKDYERVIATMDQFHHVHACDDPYGERPVAVLAAIAEEDAVKAKAQGRG